MIKQHPAMDNYVVYVNKRSKNGTFRESLNVFGWVYSSAKKYFIRRSMEFSRLVWSHPDYKVVEGESSKGCRCIKLFDGDKLIMHLEMALAKNLSKSINDQRKSQTGCLNLKLKRNELL